MKTVFINCSPKKKFSASTYFLSVQKFFVGGEKVKETLKNKQDYDRIFVKEATSFGYPLPTWGNSFFYIF